MTKKTKSKTTATTTSTTASAMATPASTSTPALKDAVKTASPAYVDSAAARPAGNGHTVTATPAAPTTVTTAKPAATSAPAAAPTTAVKPATATTTTRPGSTPVQVKFDGKPSAGPVKAVIRYSGQLAVKADKVVARVGLEWFGSPRWQAQQEVELRRAGDGVFEGELAVSSKDGGGKDLMAVQLAFLSPTTKDWDSAGAPYGYYQVSALTGHVEPVRQ